MELKEYQLDAISAVKSYTERLAEWKEKVDKNPELAEAGLDFSATAWEKCGLSHAYNTKKDGIGRPIPNFCLKIPTGGGKTFLAIKSIDVIFGTYLKKRTGLVLWIVPSEQIYSQTIKRLRDRGDPYRQHLDMVSGGRTIIVEKTDKFTPNDMAENLVVLMLMLPSANRQTKETLRMFKDNGGFQPFFPSDDNLESHEKLLKRFPNLEAFGSKDGLFKRQVKTSLGNTLRMLSPVIVLDEGHKAYSLGAQDTLCGFNPSIIVELSATPSEKSNILVNIPGVALEREEMIKLDLHVYNKRDWDWKDTLLAAAEHRKMLEERAKRYEGNTGVYIRPICLIQVERTGKDQRDGKHIHAEDAKEHLIRRLGVPEEWIAIKTSEINELRDIDDIGGLTSKECPIRYIITKQALQEGWDCHFAYVLAVLTNPGSKNALTQLVGRILRQPFARKTKIKELDESYVFCFQQRAADLLQNVRKGFEKEGLGDIVNRVRAEEPGAGASISGALEQVRKQFAQSTERIFLPLFVVEENEKWRPVVYNIDIESRIDWNMVDLSSLKGLNLTEAQERGKEFIIGLSGDEAVVTMATTAAIERTEKPDPVFLTKQLGDVVPNPWKAYEISEDVLSALIKKNGERKVADNLVFIMEEIKKTLEAQKEVLSKSVFDRLVEQKKIRFVVIAKEIGWSLPKKNKIEPGEVRLNRADGQQLQKSLFEFMSGDEYNNLEKQVAWYLDTQERLFFWYRNLERKDYAVQGWKRQKIYPDFIFTTSEKNGKTFDRVFVIETKGLFLKNPDTAYKKSVFDVCNKLAKEISMAELKRSLGGAPIHFEVIYSDEWEKRLNQLLAE